MKFPKYYFTIKTIFDLSLFGTQNPEEYLASNEKLVFSKDFIAYQAGFLSSDDPGENELLLQTCVRYLRKLDKQGRMDIVKVLRENKPVADALMMLTRLELGLLNPEEYTVNFDCELNEYVDENKITSSLLLFLQKHFLNLQRINPTDYQNFELTRSEYTELVSEYMKVQSNLL